MIRRLGFLLVSAAVLAGASMASAADWGLRGSLAGTSDYRFRGISQNDRHPAPQASINLDGPDGWYAGTWASQVNFNDHADTSIEWDIYGGKHFDLGGDTDLNIQPYYYAYPNHDSKQVGFDDSFFDMITTLTHTFGDLTLAGTVAWSPDWFAQSGTGWWLNANARYAVNDWFSFSGNLGRQSARDFDAIHGIGFPYTEWDLGATATWDQFTFDVRYIDTSISDGECAAFNGAGNGHWCTASALGTLTYSFTLL